MKLKLIRILSSNSPNSFCMLVHMRGESGEEYHFQGSATPDQRVEDMLTHIAGEIAATRRKRPAPKYKVKSIMPKRSALDGDLPTPIDPNKIVWSKDSYGKPKRKR